MKGWNSNVNVEKNSIGRIIIERMFNMFINDEEITLVGFVHIKLVRDRIWKSMLIEFIKLQCAFGNSIEKEYKLIWKQLKNHLNLDIDNKEKEKDWREDLAVMCQIETVFPFVYNLESPDQLIEIILKLQSTNE